MTYQEFISNILETRGQFGCGEAYHERHHIKPRCLGGANSKENLIDLFPREHYIAHQLLAKENPSENGLVTAWFFMSHRTEHPGTESKKKIKVTAEEYEQARIAFVKMMKESRNGENNSFYGKKHKREDLPKDIPVICLNTLEKFPSLSLGAEEKTRQGCTGCSEKNLSRAFHGQLTAGKSQDGEPLFWMKYDASKDDNYYRQLYSEAILQRNERMNQIYTIPQSETHKVRKNIINLLTGEIYESAKDVQEKTGIYHTDVAQVCRGDKKTAGENIFLYLEDYEKMNRQDKIDCLIDRWTSGENQPIVCLNNGCIYRTAKDCAEFGGVKFGDVVVDCANELCKFGGVHKESGQFLRWAYYDDYVKMSRQEIEEVVRTPVEKHQPVHCITTDKYFKDIKDAVTCYGLHSSGIHKCCQGVYKSCGEYGGKRLVWEYDNEYRWELYSSKETQKTIYQTKGLNLEKIFMDDESEEP